MCRSALRSFKRRVIYSNVGYDRILHTYIFLIIIGAFSSLIAFVFLWFSFIKTLDIVGWRTSSIRRDNELPKVYLLIFHNTIWFIGSLIIIYWCKTIWLVVGGYPRWKISTCCIWRALQGLWYWAVSLNGRYRLWQDRRYLHIFLKTNVNWCSLKCSYRVYILLKSGYIRRYYQNSFYSKWLYPTHPSMKSGFLWNPIVLIDPFIGGLT